VTEPVEIGRSLGDAELRAGLVEHADVESSDPNSEMPRTGRSLDSQPSLGRKLLVTVMLVVGSTTDANDGKR
jgi:hypothetical protein